jgi:Ornithine/acetylornithine aminotransferase
LVEPIQGEAGVYVPDEGFLKGASELCKNTTFFLLQMKFKPELQEPENSSRVIMKKFSPIF